MIRFELRAIGSGQYSRPGLLVPFAVDVEYDVRLEDASGAAADLGRLRVVFELRDLADGSWGQVYELRLYPAPSSAVLLGGAVAPHHLVQVLDHAARYMEGSARAHGAPGSPVPEAVFRVG